MLTSTRATSEPAASGVLAGNSLGQVVERRVQGMGLAAAERLTLRLGRLGSESLTEFRPSASRASASTMNAWGVWRCRRRTGTRRSRSSGFRRSRDTAILLKVVRM